MTYPPNSLPDGHVHDDLPWPELRPKPKSRIELVASECDADDNITEVCLSVDRDDEPDEELWSQALFLTPNELQDVYRKIQRYYAHGTWTVGSVER